jgi:hypothetical protein
LLSGGGGVDSNSNSSSSSSSNENDVKRDTSSALSSTTTTSPPAEANNSEEEEQRFVLQDESFAQQPLKKVRSASSLQDLAMISKPALLQEKEAASLPDYKTVGVDPDLYLIQLIQAMHPDGVRLQPKAALELDKYDFFPTITEQQMTSYTMEVVTATRQNQVEALREIVARQGPGAVDCFNRFGESLLNLACRRGFTEMVAFFIHDVGLNVRSRDDGGRTLMHDACWSACEPLLDIGSWLVEKDPSLLFIKDKRGYTAFQYARKSDWHIWRKFLFDNRDKLLQGLLQEPNLVSIFSSSQ